MSKPLRWLVCIPFLWSFGCGQQFGAFLYYINPFPSKKIPAQFRLGKERLMILVDDDQSLLTWPAARGLLIDEIGKALREARANANAIDKDEIRVMRQADPQFEERSISELGKRAGAEQILWVQVKEFVASTKIEEVSSAARFMVRVKVFDPNAATKSEMRLWPDTREGEYVTVEKSASQIQRLKHDADIARMLTIEAAQSIAKLFYAHAPDK